MDWDMKASSSHWDWDNLMLFPNRGADIGKKAQWENDTVAASGHGEMDNCSMQNGSVYSLGCGSGSTLAYGSSSKSSASVEFSTEAEPDLCKIKVEYIESGYSENRNVGFLDLRSQTDPRTTEPESRKSSEIRPNGELNGFGVKEQQESQRSFVGKELDKIGKTNASLTVAVSSGSGGDSHIGLKLGKRTYFEDVSASNGIPIKATPSLAIPAAPSASTKRPRGLSQSMQSPCCQVEGCKADLSSVKDYHRRHKVCEAHSKSSMVIVNHQEQRFCQQCSRFHILSEFDDGKRSCRRRLAGHNERRRKPQPDSLNSSRPGSSFYDSSRTGLLMDRSSFMHPKIFSSSVLDGYNDFKLGHGKGIWPRIVKTEDQLIFDGHLQTPGVNQPSYLNALSLPPAEKLYLLLQNSKAASGDFLSQGIHNYTQSQTNPVTQALTLSSSSGTGILGGLEMASPTEILSGVSIQRRALSLLSSQSRSSRAPGSSSLDLATRPGFALEQFMHENHSPMSQMPVPGMQHNFGPVTDKFLAISSQPSTGLVSSGYPAPVASSLDKVHQGGSVVPNMGGIGNFESPMHDLLRGQEMRNSHESRSKDVRPTIDLMQRSSQTQSNESQERSGIGQHGRDKGQKNLRVDNWGMRNQGWQPENKWERTQSRGMWQSHKPETSSESVNVNFRENAQGFQWRSRVNNSATGSDKDSASHEAAEVSHVRNGALPNLLPPEQYQGLSMLNEDTGAYQSGSDSDVQSMESDDDLLASGDDDDSDASDVSHETQKKNKWFRKFFHSLDSLTIEEVNDSSRQWHCPACHGGVGAIDWYKGMQPLISHAKTIRSKRVKLHRKLAKVLEEELNRRGAAGLNAEGMFGKWKGLGEVTNNQEIVWPPMVIIQNTLLDQDDKEMWLGMGNKELLEYFKGYKAMKAKHAYGPKGHRGMSVLIFEDSAMGYLEAERLHKHFVKEGRGKDDWDRCHVHFQPGGKRVLYGYMATKEDMEIFNRHSKGNARLKHDMRSYQLMVVEPMKKMNEDNQKLIWTKNKAAKEQEHNKILEEAVGIVGRKLRIKENEIKIIRQRATEQHEESTREMNYLEQSYRKELQQLSEDITRREQALEKMQEDFKKDYMNRCHQLEVDCGKLPQDMNIRKDEQEEQAKIREEIATIVELSIKETEEYERERQELIRDHDSRRKKFRVRQLCEEVGFEKECEQERFHMLDKFSKRRQEAEHCVN